MKKIFLSTLFIAGAAIAMTSCNNGNYDADPNTNNSNVINPLNPNNLSLGTIKAKLNGNEMTFSNGAGTTTSVSFGIGGNTSGSTTNFETLAIQIVNYNGAQTYEVSGTSTDLVLSYAKIENSAPTSAYGSTISPTGHVKVVVSEDADSKVKGTFEGIVYYAGPGSVNLSDSIVITDGQFYVPKM